MNDGSEQESSNFTSNHVDFRALAENLQSITALKQPPAGKMIHKILHKIKLRYQKFLLVHNVTFVYLCADRRFDTSEVKQKKWRIQETNTLFRRNL